MIAEDSGLFRQLLAGLLTENGLTVTGLAASGAELLRQVDADPPDVVILDIRLPPEYNDDGLRAAAEIRTRHPEVGLLVLSHYAETLYAVRLLEIASHSAGYLVKDRVTDGTGLLDAVRRVSRGDIVIDAEVVNRVMLRRRAHDPLARLSPSERSVLELMAAGWSNTAIAEKLGYSTKTVEKRITSLAQKLGLPPSEGGGRAGVNVRVLAVLAYLRGTTSATAELQHDRKRTHVNESGTANHGTGAPGR